MQVGAARVQRTHIRRPQKIDQTAHADVRETYMAYVAAPPAPAAASDTLPQPALYNAAARARAAASACCSSACRCCLCLLLERAPLRHGAALLAPAAARPRVAAPCCCSCHWCRSPARRHAVAAACAARSLPQPAQLRPAPANHRRSPAHPSFASCRRQTTTRCSPTRCARRRRPSAHAATDADARAILCSFCQRGISGGVAR